MFLFMCVMYALIPATMVGFGLLWQSKIPKRNWIYGYRSFRSMQSDESWHYAHQVCSRIWLRSGKLLLVVSMMMIVLAYTWLLPLQGLIFSGLIIFQTACLLLTLIPVEIALKRRFPK